MRVRSAVMGVAAAAFLVGGVTQAAFADDDYSRPGPYLSAGFSWGKEAMDVDAIRDDVTAVRRAEQFAASDTCSSSSPVFDCNQNARFDRQDSPGADVRVGYRINKIFAAELNFEYFDNYEIALHGADLRRLSPFTSVRLGEQDIAEIRVYNFFANMRAYAWTGVLQPYGLLGIGAVYADAKTKVAQTKVEVSEADPDVQLFFKGNEDDVAFAGRLGGGLDYYFTNNVVLNFDVGWILTTDMRFGTFPDSINLNQVPITTSLMYRFN